MSHVPTLRLLATAALTAGGLLSSPLVAQEGPPPTPAPHGEDVHEGLSPEDLEALLEQLVGEGGGYYFGGDVQLGGGVRVEGEAPRLPAGLHGDPFAPLMGDLVPPPDRARTAAGRPGPEYWQQKVDYRIRTRLIPGEHRVVGEERITYHNHSPYVLHELWLQLDDNWLAPDSLDVRTTTVEMLGGTDPGSLRDWLARQRFHGGVDLKAVRWEGNELETRLQGTRLRVTLPMPLPPGETFVFDVAWEVVINPAHLADSRAGAEHLRSGAWLYEVAHWYPRLCAFYDPEGWQTKPFLGQAEFALEFGDFDVSITVPDTYVVAATGELVNRTEVLTPAQLERWNRAMTPGNDGPLYVVTPEEADANAAATPTGEKTWRFRARRVRDFAWAASPAFRWDCWGVQLEPDGPVVACQSFWPKEGGKAWELYSTRAVAHALEVYSRFTFPYPYPSAVSVNGPVYGMEYPMICFNSPRSSDDPNEFEMWMLVSVVIHEVGHNFFPMIVNNDEREWAWMDEGLNTFVEGIASAEWEDGPPFWLDTVAMGAMLANPDGAQPIMTPADDTRDYGWNAYGKPALGLRLLRDVVLGPEVFDDAFRSYARAWMFKRPLPSDFFRRMEEASGQDLDWFWRGWFFDTAYVDLGATGLEPIPAGVLAAARAPKGSHGYVLGVRSYGGLPMPILLRLEFTDGTGEDRVVPVEVWRRNPERVELVLITDRPLRAVVIDPEGRTHDADPSDNAVALDAATAPGTPLEIPLESESEAAGG